MGPGGMFTRWLHTWYFTLRRGASSHLLHSSPTPTKTCSDASWLRAHAAEMPANRRERDPRRLWAGLVNDGGSFLRGHTRSGRPFPSTPAIFPFCRFIGYCSGIKVPSLPLRWTIACVMGTMWPQRGRRHTVAHV